METAILRERLRVLKRDKTFVPFTFITKDGRRFDVDRPWHFAMGASLVVVARPQVANESFRAEEVAAIEVHQPAA
ncbi:MAG: hypothetical protein H7144_10715 [Burkholderiales bacterium]|nr:hypothetical protein [Phycisphaerae bacterium]